MTEAIEVFVEDTIPPTARALDQFYTHPKISKRFVEKVDELYDLSKFDYVIEPSMGEGFIYDCLPKKNRVGLDIEKNHPDCLEGDFLEWKPEKSGIVYAIAESARMSSKDIAHQGFSTPDEPLELSKAAGIGLILRLAKETNSVR